MLESIIDFINLKLGLLNYFEKTHCLSTLVKNDDGLIYPAEYISNGDFDAVDFDAYDGVSYIRVNGEIDVERVDQRYTPKPRLNVTFPLRLVYAVRKDKLTKDDAYSFDRVRGSLVKQLESDSADLANQLEADKIVVNTSNYISDTKELWDEETAETGTFQPKYEVVFGAMEVSVTVTTRAECIPSECDDFESDILKTFDFCKQSIIDRLTPTQITCLESEFGGADATVNVNSNLFDTVSAGGTLNVPVQYENGTPVGTITGGVVEIPDALPSVSLVVSNLSPDFGDTVTLTATPSVITPTSYLFFAWRSDTDELEFLQESASNTYNWTTNVVGTWSVHVIADDGSDFASDCKEVVIAPDTDAEAYLDEVAIPNDATVYFSGTDQEVTGAKYWYYVNRLVKGMKDDSLWAEGHYMYLYIGGAASVHKINLFDPQDTDAAFRADFNGGWIHDKDGLTANGTNTYADTHFNSNTHLAINDGAFAIYKRTQPTGTVTGFEWGANDGTGGFAHFSSKSTANRSFYGEGTLRQVIGIPTTVLDGCHITTRDNNSALQKWFGNNGTLLDSDTTAFTNHPNYNEYIGARNNSGTAALYVESGCVYGLIGRFDGLSDALATSLRTRIDTFMTSLRLNV